MIRVLLDQGLPRSAAEVLRSAGWDVLHASECGLSTSTDEAILSFARENHRAVCTLDADFHALLAVSGALGPSVIRIRREGLRGADLAGLLQKVWGEVASFVDGGAMVTVTERAIRVRKLPVLGQDAKGSTA